VAEATSFRADASSVGGDRELPSEKLTLFREDQAMNFRSGSLFSAATLSLAAGLGIWLAGSNPLFAYQYDNAPRFNPGPMPGPEPFPPARITPNVSDPTLLQPAGSLEQQNLEERAREERQRQERRQRERDAAAGSTFVPTTPVVDMSSSRYDISQATDPSTPDWKRLREEREQIRLEREALQRERREFDEQTQDRQARRVPLEGAADLKKFVFRGDLSNFVLDKERGTGAFLFRDSQKVPQLYVVRLRYKSTDARGYVRYESVGEEGTVTDWAFYCGAATTPGDSASVASVSVNGAADSGSTGSYPVYLSLDHGKAWHQYETAGRRAGN